jgi:sugar/nucleoside kinase (ribokinase family)
MPQPKMLSIGTATQDVFLVGGSIFSPVRTHDGKLYEHLPLGAKLDLEDVVFTTGGNAANAAVTFARQDLESRYMGVVGTEPSGQAVMQDLDQEGVDTSAVHQGEQYHTGYSTILLAPNGERTIMRYHGDKLRDDGRDLHLESISHADWLYLSSVGSMELLEKIISEARKRHTKVAFNPSSTELEEPAKIRALLEDVTILIANKEEMATLVEGKTSEELVKHALHFVDVAIVSDGPHGAVASDGKQLVTAGIYEDVKVVDRLGAGDAFGSGFTAMIAQGKALEEAVVFASANSTSVVTKIGAKAGILHRGEKLHSMPLKVTTL